MCCLSSKGVRIPQPRFQQVREPSWGTASEVNARWLLRHCAAPSLYSLSRCALLISWKKPELESTYLTNSTQLIGATSNQTHDRTDTFNSGELSACNLLLRSAPICTCAVVRCEWGGACQHTRATRSHGRLHISKVRCSGCIERVRET